MKGQQQIKILSTVPGRMFRSTCSLGKIEILLWPNIRTLVRTAFLG